MLQVFDIIGPIMIGPSSSHTAGAVRIGKYARSVLGKKPVKAVIQFSGPFANPYKRQGNPKAVLAGILGMDTDGAFIRIRMPFLVCSKRYNICMCSTTSSRTNEQSP